MGAGLPVYLEAVTAARIVMYLNGNIRLESVCFPDLLAERVVFLTSSGDSNRDSVFLQLLLHPQSHL